MGLFFFIIVWRKRCMPNSNYNIVYLVLHVDSNIGHPK